MQKIKDIIDILKDSDIEIAEEKSADLRKAVAEHYKTINEFTKKVDKYEEQLSTANNTITDLKGKLQNAEKVDVEALQQKIADYEQAEQTARYKAQLSAQTALTKAQISAQTKAQEKAEKAAEEAAYIIKTNKGALSYNYTGSLKDNGVSVYYTTDSKGNAVTRYVDNNSGKVTEIASNVNPYAFTVNNDTANGVFSNGYQPNNIYGKKLTDTGQTIELVDSDGNSKGRTQKVFSITTGRGKNKTVKYYTWNGECNVYSQIKKNGNSWEVVQEKVGKVTKAKV